MTADGTVTVMVTRTVRVGEELSYETWIHGVAEAAHAFPGHLGLTVVRPRAGSRDYTLLFRFDTVDHLRDWQGSQVCGEWAERANAISERTKVQQLSGLETWFAPADGAPFAPPPRWKMAFVSWLVAFPLIQGLNVSLAPWLAPLPRVLRGAVLGLAMIVIMTYAAMPVVTRALARWLYPKAW